MVRATTHPDHLFRANPENEFGSPERGFLHAIALKNPLALLQKGDMKGISDFEIREMNSSPDRQCRRSGVFVATDGSWM